MGLCLNKAASDEIIWHCKHYTGRGVMKFYESGAALASDMGVPVSVLEEPFYVAIITPVIHYCMGGLEIDVDSAVCGPDGQAIPGLYAAGEIAGGVHGNNRLGGNSLLDCVVFGRVAGKAACKWM